MKKIFLIALVVSSQLYAQQLQTVPRMARQAMNQEFYNEQANLWKNETEKNKKNAQAWQNYFLAVRYSSTLPKGSKITDKNKLIEQIIKDFEMNAPNAIEYVRCKLLDWGTEKNTPSTLKLIEKGFAINPNDADVLECAANYYELNAQTEKLKDLYTRLGKTKVHEFELMEFNYNMLMSLDKNAIIFTNGDNDTYPARILQAAKGIRTDITLINTSLGTYYPEYLKGLLKQKNIILSDEFLKTGLDAKASTDFIKKLVIEINKKYPSVPLFFAITSDTQGLFEDSLYCTGLAYQYSAKKMDNYSKLKYNVENKFHLDYLRDSNFDSSTKDESYGSLCKQNYIPAFGLLYRHNKNLAEQNEKTFFYKNFIMEFAIKNGQEKEMKEYLDGK